MSCSPVALMPELTLPQPRPDIVVRPVRDIAPHRSVLWVRGRPVPALAPMAAALRAAAAQPATG